MKLSKLLGLIVCFALTACGGGGRDTLNSNQTGLNINTVEDDQIAAIARLGDNRSSDALLKQECDRLKSLNTSGNLRRLDLLKLEADGVVRSVYYNEFGLFDPRLEPLEVDQALYILGRIVNDGGTKRFENIQPAFGKTTVTSVDEKTVITANTSIQRTAVDFYSSTDSDLENSVRFTTDTVGSFGVENRATFEYRRVEEDDLKEMVFTIDRYCLNR